MHWKARQKGLLRVPGTRGPRPLPAVLVASRVRTPGGAAFSYVAVSIPVDLHHRSTVGPCATRTTESFSMSFERPEMQSQTLPTTAEIP
jgi:hypothetical protein